MCWGLGLNTELGEGPTLTAARMSRGTQGAPRGGGGLPGSEEARENIFMHQRCFSPGRPAPGPKTRSPVRAPHGSGPSPAPGAQTRRTKQQGGLPGQGGPPRSLRPWQQTPSAHLFTNQPCLRSLSVRPPRISANPTRPPLPAERGCSARLGARASATWSPRSQAAPAAGFHTAGRAASAARHSPALGKAALTFLIEGFLDFVLESKGNVLSEGMILKIGKRK